MADSLLLIEGILHALPRWQDTLCLELMLRRFQTIYKQEDQEDELGVPIQCRLSRRRPAFHFA